MTDLTMIVMDISIAMTQIAVLIQFAASQVVWNRVDWLANVGAMHGSAALRNATKSSIVASRLYGDTRPTSLEAPPGT